MAGKYKKKKITTNSVEALMAGDVISDTHLPGYHARCQKEAKVYYVRKYAHGRRHHISIGEHGVMGITEKKARDQAIVILAALSDGLDPSAERAKAKGMPTLSEYAEEFFEQRDGILKPSTLNDYRGTIAIHIKKHVVGKVKLDKVERIMLTQIHKKLKNKPRTANKILQIISSMYGEAAKEKLVPDGFNPAKHIKHYKIKARQRFLSESELARLGSVMTASEADGSANPYVTAALRLLIFTGARLNEILSLRWEWVDMERGYLNLPDNKLNDIKTIHLSPPALEVLADLPRVEGNPFVIIGQKRGKHLVNLSKPWAEIQLRAKLEPMTLSDGKKLGVRLHDLRHSYASLAASGGASLHMIGALMGHSQVSTTARYAHLADDPLRSVNDAAGRKAAAAMNSNGVSAEVVPFEVKR